MVETEILYSEYPQMRECDVTLLEIRQVKKSIALLFDRTIFYPEGGGPAGDQGWIGEIPILDTQKNREGEILHYVSSAEGLAVGKVSRIRLDWSHRYRYMVEHTGQHLVSGLLYSLFGIGTLSVHMGDDGISIETDADEISEQELDTLVEEVEKAIRSSAGVSSRIVDRSSAENLGLRRSIKVESDPRIVTISGYDDIACGGIHLENTSLLKRILYKGREKIRGHVRLFFSFEEQAKREVRAQQKTISELVESLSAQVNELPAKVEGLKDALNTARREVNDLQYLLIAGEIRKSAEQALPFSLDLSEYPFDALAQAAKVIEEYSSLTCCLLQQKDDTKSAYLIGIKGSGKDTSLLYQKLKENVLLPEGAKGGGRDPVWRGVVETPDTEDFLSRCRRVLSGETDA